MESLGNQLVSMGVKRVLGKRLRVLAYHGVANPADLDRHLSQVLKRFTVVSGHDVVAAARGKSCLPSDAVWITFDDGLESVVSNAREVLEASGITATLFVCPGLVESTRLPWWTVIESAITSGWRLSAVAPEHTIGTMKSLPDARRRQELESAQEFLLSRPDANPTPTMADLPALRRWLEAGHQLGNHSWDHPCLNQCGADEQRRQIVDADRWLDSMGAFSTGRVFAYPNGDWTQETENVLSDLGYDVALLFDHRASSLKAWNPLRTSRYRIDTSASDRRTRAIVSGVHSLVYRQTSPTKL